MKCNIPLYSAFFGLSAANHVVVSLGSSYASGYGLNQSYGSILADLLKNYDGATTEYIQGAMPGSILSDVPSQATNITQNTTVVTLTSGGNDVNYVGCLFLPSHSGCSAPGIDVDTWTDRFNLALDSIISNLHNAGVGCPTDVPIYLVTYPRALGADSNCGSSNPNCPLTPTQFTNLENIYNNFTDWTVNAFHAYKSSHSYNLNLLDMRPLSAKHDVGSKDPWINGDVSQASTLNGAPWHPNKSGVTFIASAIFAGVEHKPSPTPKN